MEVEILQVFRMTITEVVQVVLLCQVVEVVIIDTVRIEENTISLQEVREVTWVVRDRVKAQVIHLVSLRVESLKKTRLE